MSESQPVTFRDFAGAVMQGDVPAAARVLEQLLELDAAGAEAATRHFQAQMAASPDFVMKAMGLRTAVTSKDDGQISALVGECFGLSGEGLSAAVRALRRRYG